VFLQIKPSHSEYIDADTAGSIFGYDVAESFPPAGFDILEAAKCLSLERYTASVFHLMRVLEIGLRAFAARFGIQADHSNWHPVIDEIQKAIRDMGTGQNTRPEDWRDQKEFFSQAASHFMLFKDAWRNYTAQARGKYTEEEAVRIFDNTRGFMQKLATRLHE
jgi:hypothetical protein